MRMILLEDLNEILKIMQIVNGHDDWSRIWLLVWVAEIILSLIWCWGFRNICTYSCKVLLLLLSIRFFRESWRSEKPETEYEGCGHEVMRLQLHKLKNAAASFLCRHQKKIVMMVLAVRNEEYWCSGSSLWSPNWICR